MTLKCISFNQDYTCLSIGTDNGYKVFNCDPFGECFEKSDDGGASITEMLFSTSLIGIVGLGDTSNTSRRKLKIINTKRKVIICELTFPGPILSIKLNRKRLIVVLIDQIFIYDVSCMKLLHTIETSNSNTMGIAELSSNQDSILVFPSADNSNSIPFEHSTGNDRNNHSNNNPIKLSSQVQQGSVIIFDTISLQPLNIIQCHKSPLQKISISKDGTLLATASIKGTIIRVFRISDGKKLYEFRRGSYSAVVTSLSFSLNNSILGCCSSTGTIHLFKLNDSNTSLKKTNQFSNGDYSEGVVKNDSENNSATSNPMATTDDGLQSSQLPTETRLTDEENEELNNILKTTSINDTFNNSHETNFLSRRKKSISDYLWNSAFSVSSKVKGQVNNYLPNTVTSMIEPKRHFAFIKLPNSIPDEWNLDETNNPSSDTTSATANTLPLTLTTTTTDSKAKENNNKHQIESIVSINLLNSTVAVATKDGNFFIYSLPSLEKGGECILLNQYRIN